MEKLKEFWNNYKGAIIGVIVAILILATKIYNLIVARLLSLPRASTIYKKLGFHYLYFK